MSDPLSCKDDLGTAKNPPPAYSEVNSPLLQENPGGPPHGGCPPQDQEYPLQPYPQPNMQGYHYPPAQPPSDGGKADLTMATPCQQGQSYPQGPHPQGGNPQGAGYPKGAGYPQGGYPHGGYPQGGNPHRGYPQAQYPGQPTRTVVVTQPSGATVVVAQAPAPDNLFLSVLACLCCFCPTGICAIIYSCQAQSANENYDFQAAMKYGKIARRLAITSIIIGIIFVVIVFILQLSRLHH